MKVVHVLGLECDHVDFELWCEQVPVPAAEQVDPLAAYAVCAEDLQVAPLVPSFWVLDEEVDLSVGVVSAGTVFGHFEGDDAEQVAVGAVGAPGGVVGGEVGCVGEPESGHAPAHEGGGVRTAGEFLGRKAGGGAVVDDH